MNTALAIVIAASLNAGIVEIQQNGTRWSGTIVHVYQGETEIRQTQFPGVTTRHTTYHHQVLTCAHSFNPKQPVEVLINRNEWHTGRLIAIDPKTDLGLIELPLENKRLSKIGLADRVDEKGEGTLAGFGHKVYRERKTKYATVNGQLKTEAMVRFGDSGGAFLIGGEVGGVIVSTNYKSEQAGAKPGNEQYGYCVPIAKVHRFLIDKGGWD